jgi:hypothetical protein
VAALHQSDKRGVPLLVVLLLMLIFAISYEQGPLYSFSQNTYFLHGLADGEPGVLKEDWLAQTTDPFPVFSALVNATTHVLDEKAFYVYYMVILGIYIYSILGIASYAYNINDEGTKYLSYFLVLLLLYSGLLFSVLSKLPMLRGIASLAHPEGELIAGVARQYLLVPFFQPSVFGVFIVLSIRAFLYNRPFAAVVSLAIAATFHSTYLLSGAVLTFTYMLILFVEKQDLRKALLVGTLSLVLIIR